MGCGQKKLLVSVAVPSAPVQVYSQRPLAPCVMSVANEKGPFINYVRVPREGGGGWKNPYILLLWGGQTHSYLVFSKSIFYIINRPVKWLAGIIFHLRLEGKKVKDWLFLLVLQRMNSVKYNFFMLKNEMEFCVRIGGGVWKILRTLTWG